jgi:hypothetical protein
MDTIPVSNKDVIPPPSDFTVGMTAEDIYERNKEAVKSLGLHLQALSHKYEVQYYLDSPAVRTAFEIWGGKNVVLTDDQVRSIKSDQGVQTIYPMILEVASLCDKLQLKLPVQDIIERKSGLSKSTIDEMFGADFGKELATEREAYRQKIIGIRQINEELLKLFQDYYFQRYIRMPLVKTAVEIWAGRHVELTEAMEHAIKTDSWVHAVYPKVADFAAVCAKYNMKIPCDFLLVGKSELDDAYITQEYGKSFCDDWQVVKRGTESLITKTRGAKPEVWGPAMWREVSAKIVTYLRA